MTGVCVKCVKYVFEDKDAQGKCFDMLYYFDVEPLS